MNIVRNDAAGWKNKEHAQWNKLKNLVFTIKRHN